MKPGFVFFILTAAIVTSAIALPFFMNGNTLWYFEGCLCIAIISLVFLYFKLVKPITALRTGMSLLNAQDFASRLRQVGQRDADDIVFVFNRMMDQLKEERLHVREQNHFLD